MPYTVTCRTADGVERVVEQNDANVCPVYHYDKVGKYFLARVTEAKKYDRGGPNFYVAPAASTPIAPPERELGNIQVFNEETQEWSQVEDLRGIYWSTEQASLGMSIEIVDPVADLPVGITTHKPCTSLFGEHLCWDSENCCWHIEPDVQLTAEEKLANAGLSVDELKGLLGL